ncbi:hypothetical protein CPC08DRAFT_737257 [Agrocybe pediades]|nr:hypothetical protein CPC08DRAFT_737257 [Agrocybe pediades]
MNRECRTKKIVELSEEELVTLEFLGDNTLAGVRAIVQKVRADPERLGSVTCFQVDCLKRKYTPQPSAQGAAGFPSRSRTSHSSPTSPVVNQTDTLSSRLRKEELAAHTVVPPDLISPFEKKFWYHGISENPPELLYRSDLETNHFPTQHPGERFYTVPTKTAYGVFGTRLNKVWNTVGPQIRDSVKARGLKYSAIKTARFSTVVEVYGEETFGPVVVWIAVHPNTTNAEAVRDATPDILHILNDAQVTGVVVEWYEGTVERLSGPPLMSIEDDISPIFGLNHPFSIGLGIPIARVSDDAQGTIALLFREVKTSDGNPSNTILALTNKHVVSLDTTTDYDFDPANPQTILVCGEHRFDRALNEIEDAVNTGLRDAVQLAGYLKDLESKSDGQITEVIQHKRTVLDYKHEDNATLQEFFDEVNEKWRDANNRKLGQVHWAPQISVKVDNHHYTRDIATLVVDEEKLKNFTGNVVDLGNLHTSTQLNYRFWPVDAIRKNRSIPGNNLQLPIRRALPRHLPINPDTQTKDGEPLYVVGKYGNTSELTFGNYSSMHAYICTESGLESREVVVYNSGTEKRPADDFSAKGDSGSLIFNGHGDGLAVLHSGMPRGEDNHVSYATPLWWVLEQVLERYPYAEFYGMEYQP